MLVDQYVDALLSDAVLADAVWELWIAGVITDSDAARAWWLVSSARHIRPDDASNNRQP